MMKTDKPTTKKRGMTVTFSDGFVAREVPITPEKVEEIPGGGVSPLLGGELSAHVKWDPFTNPFPDTAPSDTKLIYNPYPRPLKSRKYRLAKKWMKKYGLGYEVGLKNFEPINDPHPLRPQIVAKPDPDTYRTITPRGVRVKAILWAQHDSDPIADIKALRDEAFGELGGIE